MKKVIIIPNENKTNIPIFVKQCDQFHEEGLKKFFYQTDIAMPIQKGVRVTYEMIDYLVEEGYCVTMLDDIEKTKFLIIYLPEKISTNQLAYFENKLDTFSDFYIAANCLNEENEIIPNENITPDNLIELLKERHYTITQNNSNTKTKVKKQEHNN